MAGAVGHSTMLGWVRGLSTAKDVLWVSGIVVGMTIKDKITRCQPQHRELNQSILTCSRAQHMRLRRKEGKGEYSTRWG